MFDNKLQEAGKTMIAGGVHPKYVRRTVREVRDHFNDLKSNLIRNGIGEAEAAWEAEEKIGNLQNIAIEAVNKKELKSWISLHPKTTFLAGPVIGFFLTVVGMVVIVFVLSIISESTGQVFAYPYPLWFVAFMKTLVFFNMYLMPGLLAVLFIYLAKDRAASTSLIIASVLVSAFLSSMFSWRVGFPQGAEETGYFAASFSIFGFFPRISGGPEFHGFAFELSVLLGTLFRIALALGAAGTAWWWFRKTSWLIEKS